MSYQIREQPDKSIVCLMSMQPIYFVAIDLTHLEIVIRQSFRVFHTFTNFISIVLLLKETLGKLCGLKHQ